MRNVLLNVPDENSKSCMIHYVKTTANKTYCTANKGVNLSRLNDKTMPTLGYTLNLFIKSAQYESTNNFDIRNTVYVALHCYTVISAMKSITVFNGKPDTLTLAIMIPDLFIKRYKANQKWYFFDGDVKVNGRYLHTYHGEEYERCYEELLSKKLYRSSMPATKVFAYIVRSILGENDTIIVWSDRVNEFNNTIERGVCNVLGPNGDITSYVGPGEHRSCLVLDCCPVYYDVFEREIDDLFEYYSNKSPVKVYEHEFYIFDVKSDAMLRFFKLAFIQGYMGVEGLNRIAQDREIALSPLGMFDCSIKLSMKINLLTSIYCEILYLGAVLASMSRDVKVNAGEFDKGRLQFDLRKVTPRMFIWENVRPMMVKCKMGNTNLTTISTSEVSKLVGVSPACTIPNEFSPYLHGFIHEIVADDVADHDYDVEEQMKVYAECAPYIDHSQATMFTIPRTEFDVTNVLLDSYYYKLKTGVYQFNFKSSTNESDRSSTNDSD